MRTRDREENDFYRTPIEAVRLISHMVTPNAWEPCAGDGRISLTLGLTHASDIDPKHDSIKQIDFLQSGNIFDADMIVTNPPFKLWREIINHSFELNLPALLLIPEEKLAGSNNKDLQRHVYYRGTVSSLIKFDTLSGRIVNGNGTLRCGWFLFKPEPRTTRLFESEYLHYGD